MIDISAINAQLVRQDQALRAIVDEASSNAVLDPGMQVLVRTLGAALTAIHERQGNLITLMLQTNV